MNNFIKHTENVNNIKVKKSKGKNVLKQFDLTFKTVWGII